MKKCSTPECTRISHPELQGMCVGCFYVFEFKPARDTYFRLKDRFSSAIVNVPKAEFDIMTTQSSRYTRSI